METPPKVECYEAWRVLREESHYKTSDGIVVRLGGAAGNPRSHTIELSDSDGRTVSYKQFWGSEGVARALTKHRNEKHEHPQGSKRDRL